MELPPDTCLRTLWFMTTIPRLFFHAELPFLSFLSHFLTPLTDGFPSPNHEHCTTTTLNSMRLVSSNYLPYLHDAFITTVFVSSLPKMPATAQILGQPLLILHVCLASNDR